MLHFTLAGPEHAPLVVLLHGFLGSHRDWDALVHDLSGDFRCLAVDLPGHGWSSIEATTDFPGVATALIDLIDSVDADSFSVLGYSMGGRIGLYVASIYAMRIDALLLESTMPGLRTEAERIARRESDARWSSLLAGDFAAFLEAWYGQPLFASLDEYPTTRERLLADRLQNDPAQLEIALRAFSVASQPSLWADWRANHVPTLLIAGERDAKYCGLMREMADANPTAELVIVPGAGHNVHAEAPEAYNHAVLSFLRRTLRP